MSTTQNTLEINKKRNFVTSLWSRIRHGLLANIRKELKISNQVYDLHKHWLGNLHDKKVLDLGCFEGNHLSVYIAQNAKEYIGLDLSDIGIAKLNEKNMVSMRSVKSERSKN